MSLPSSWSTIRPARTRACTGSCPSTRIRPPRASGRCPDHSGCWPSTPRCCGPQGDVLRRSGNNQVRAASPDYGNVAKGIYTSVTWDPAAPAAGGANFFHPDTITGPDHKPIDFFCGGDTSLPDGTLLSAAATWPTRARAGRCRRLLPGRPQRHHLAHMQQGRWYPTLLPLADGRVLAVSGLNEKGTRTRPSRSTPPAPTPGTTCRCRRAASSSACPCTRTCSCSATAGCSLWRRTDDPNVQVPVLMDLTTNPVTITGVPGLADPATRDQSASVLLPPAQDQRVMILGGGPGDASNATGSTATVDLTAEPGVRACRPDEPAADAPRRRPAARPHRLRQRRRALPRESPRGPPAVGNR